MKTIFFGVFLSLTLIQGKDLIRNELYLTGINIQKEFEEFFQEDSIFLTLNNKTIWKKGKNNSYPIKYVPLDVRVQSKKAVFRLYKQNSPDQLLTLAMTTVQFPYHKGVERIRLETKYGYLTILGRILKEKSFPRETISAEAKAVRKIERKKKLEKRLYDRFKAKKN